MNSSKKQRKKQKNSVRQKAFRKSSSSTLQTASPDTGRLEMSPLPASVPLILCSSLDELLFTDFIKCVCDKDYSVLVLSGTAAAEEIEAAWLKIVSEYMDIAGSKEADQHNDLSSRIDRLNTKIMAVTCLIEAVRTNPDPDLINELRETWGYAGKFNEKTLESDLKTIENRLRNDKHKLAIARQEYEDIQGKSSAEQENTKKSYMSMLFAIEEKRKMEFDIDKLTAYKFAIEYKKFIDYYETVKNKYSGYGTK